MKIGLLMPVRERLNLTLTLICSIITTVKDIENIEILMGIDDDDPTRDIQYKISKSLPFVKIIPIHNEGKFIGINRIWNILASHCTSEIFGYIGNDMVFRTPDWDEQILKEFRNNLPADKIKMVHCWDGYHGPNLCVNAFVHRKYYEVMGYFCRPEFLINYSDKWMYQQFKAFDRVTYLPDVHIEHNHWVFKRREKDATAERMLSNNHDKDSDQMWETLKEERYKDINKLGEYLHLQPQLQYLER
jgi:hypothetical protein